MVGSERGHQMADRLKPHSQTTSLSVTQTTTLSNSIKLSHAVWGHPRWTGHGGEVWQYVVHWRREWQIISVFLPWEPHEKCTKQKDRTLKNELPRSIGAQYATGDLWRNNSRKNEWLEPKQNNTQLWVGLVIEARFDAVESNVAYEPGLLGPWIKTNWKWSNRRWQERT